MVELLRWPAAIRAQSVSFNPRGQVIGGPVSLANRSQVVSFDGGYWTASIDVATLGMGAPVNAFRALRAQMEGGAHHVLVPTFDQGQAPWPRAGGWQANENAPQPWGDLASFTDDTGWYMPAIRVYLAEDAALRATSIVADVQLAGDITAGMMFSLLGGGLHTIKQVISTSGSQMRLGVSPPLRAAAPAGRRLNFENPVCRMRLMSEGDADLALARLWMASPSMTFIEAYSEL